MLMLKKTMSLQLLIADKLLIANKIDSIEGDNGNELIKKFTKLKIGKLSKDQKLSKSKKSNSKKSAKSKKLSKNKNSPKFITKKAGSNFLTLKAKAIFNCLWLAFTKASIL